MNSTEDTTSDTPPGESPLNSQPRWTYPTRTCRLCLEEVPATVTLYPPGLPPAFQRPVVEYKNDDEYGRLIKPCHCRGGMRYIHELCLRRSRTESVRPGSLWKCHECGYQFNFNRLTIQKYLGSKMSSGVLTVLVMFIVIFFLGFVADPILNLYTDPYETIVGHEDVWQQVDVNDSKDSLSGWAQHFIKGLVSMGVLSFLRTMMLNPFQWWNLRNTGFVTGRLSGRSATGRDRAVNISWIVVAMGILSASYFFYQWVQKIIGRSLQRIGNNIVDTQLPGDDDDLKPPSGFKFEKSYSDVALAHAERPHKGEEVDFSETPENLDVHNDATINRLQSPDESRLPETTTTARPTEIPSTQSPMPGTWESTGYSSALDETRSHGWSF